MFDTIGSTADEIAARLRELCVRGVPNTVASLNPIGNYVGAQMTVDAMMVDVSRGTITLIFPGHGIDVIPMPRPVVDFLKRFNRGDYPDLIMDLRGRL